jgi:serine/threonine protein kinase
MIQEYQPGVRVDRGHHTNPYVIQEMMRQLLTAMHALEQRKIVHRDIAVQNITWDPLRMHLTLIDFDTAVKRRKRFYCQVGRPNYDPPEKLQMLEMRQNLIRNGLMHVPKKDRKYHYDWRCDIYAAGIVFFMLLKNRNHSPSPEDVRKYVKAGLKRKRHHKYPELDLLFRMLSYDPARRPSATEALKHPYFEQKLETAQEEYERVRERMQYWQQQDRSLLWEELGKKVDELEMESSEEEDEEEEKEPQREQKEEEQEREEEEGEYEDEEVEVDESEEEEEEEEPLEEEKKNSP